MTLQKPEDLAYKTTEHIEQAATGALKQKAILGLAVFGVSIGMLYASPQTLLPSIALLTIFNIWDAKRDRSTLINMRDGYNEVAAGIEGHESVYQMAPLQKAVAQVKNFGLHDLNLVEHFKKNKFNTAVAVLAPLIIDPMFAPLALTILVNASDTKKLLDIRAAAKESNENLCRKYPTQFPTNML